MFIGTSCRGSGQRRPRDHGSREWRGSHDGEEGGGGLQGVTAGAEGWRRDCDAYGVCGRLSYCH